MQPRSGNTSDGQTFGPVVKAYVTPLQTTYGTTYLVADSALYHEDNLQKLAETTVTWMTRVPATLGAAHAALAQATPSPLPRLTEGYRDQVLPSTSGGVAQRWLLLASEPRYAQAQRTVDKQLRQHSAQESTAFTQLCRRTFACEADAHQALTTFEAQLTGDLPLHGHWTSHTARWQAGATASRRPTRPSGLADRRRPRLLPRASSGADRSAPVCHPGHQCTG
jgi:transposase